MPFSTVERSYKRFRPTDAFDIDEDDLYSHYFTPPVRNPFIPFPFALNVVLMSRFIPIAALHGSRHATTCYYQ